MGELYVNYIKINHVYICVTHYRRVYINNGHAYACVYINIIAKLQFVYINNMLKL